MQYKTYSGSITTNADTGTYIFYINIPESSIVDSQGHTYFVNDGYISSLEILRASTTGTDKFQIFKVSQTGVMYDITALLQMDPGIQGYTLYSTGTIEEKMKFANLKVQSGFAIVIIWYNLSGVAKNVSCVVEVAYP
jgi:hypothetical protein